MWLCQLIFWQFYFIMFCSFHLKYIFQLDFIWFFCSFLVKLSGIGGTKSPDKNAFSLNKPVPGALYWKKATFLFLFGSIFISLDGVSWDFERRKSLRRWRRAVTSEKNVSLAIGFAPNRWQNKNPDVGTLYTLLMRL